MNTRTHTESLGNTLLFKRSPLAHAIALMLATGSVMGHAQAQQAFSAAWYAQKGAVQAAAVATGKLPNGMPAMPASTPLAQQQAANTQLQRSLANLNSAARAIALQQAQQSAARLAANGTVPDGLGVGGLDAGSLVNSWINANGPTQSTANGKTIVDIKQTADKAILNWETFNIGKNTVLQFDQQADWSVLNRINNATAPSVIQGQIKAPGTVMIVNANGIIFTGSSQVNTRNLVVAAAHILDSQFNTGIYSPNASTASFTDANGNILIEAGAHIATHEPASVTAGGGYVLLMGKEVSNAGEIITRKGQATLAAGDSFYIRKGAGTEGNTYSTTRGNEVAVQINAGSDAGKVTNTGLIMAREGDVTLTGRDVQQNGVAVATTTVNTRGTVHLLNSASDTQGSVTLGEGSTTSILIEDDGKTTALDSQRDALIKDSAVQDGLRIGAIAGNFDNLSVLADRRDQSRIEIVSGGDVHFAGDSLTVATGGQIAVSAKGRTFVADKAQLDVSGAVGVNVAMEANNVLVNVQGNELRDSPGNRDAGSLFNSNIWIDRRDLILVPAGTGGYASDRWYAAGGLLEVSGYLSNQGHSIGEWAAQGGTLTLGGSEVIAQQGSIINLSGGSYNVQTGMISQTWLKGSDGKLYRADQAPAGLSYSGLYKGFEDVSERWGEKATKYYYNPLIAARQRLENGYTVGRDGGKLIINAPTAVMEGELITTVFNGERQVKARDAIDDGYRQAQTAAALNAQIAVGRYGAGSGAGMFESDIRFGTVDKVTAGMTATDALDVTRNGTVWFDTGYINALQLGGLDIATSDTITVERALTLANGGKINFIAPVVDIKADVTAHSGSISINNTFTTSTGRGVSQILLKNGSSSIILRDGAKLDMSGLWVNSLLNEADNNKLAYLNGGSVRLQSTNNVVLEANSVIDVSSGAAVVTGGKSRGGRGGNVTLVVEDKTGVLKLDGNIKGYGVSGGGKLTVSSGAGIGIGGKLLDTDGVLGAGEKAPVDLILLQDFEVRAGDVLPVDYSYTTNVARPGETIGTTNLAIVDVVLAADWTPPRSAAGSIGYVIYTNVGVFGVNADNPLSPIPAGTRITSIPDRVFPASYVVPGDVFPNGIGIWDKTVTITAGMPSPVDFVVASGTRVPNGTVFASAMAVGPVTTLNTALMQSGFSSYDINGGLGLVVAAGTRLDVSVPVYRFTDAAFSKSTGTVSALEIWTPPLWTEDAGNSRLTQRAGASLTLRSNGTSLYGGGSLDIRTGAVISVDPGQAISLNADSLSVDGRLTASAGSITLNVPGSADFANSKPGLIWIGEHAVLDVAARAATSTNIRGQTYGVIANGGSILIGGAMDWEAKGESITPNAFVVIRPGALLDASGTSAILDMPSSGFAQNGSPRTIASDGGTIVLKSSNGLYLDGTMRAVAGGANAAGGTLTLALEAPNYPTMTTSGDVLRHRELVLADLQGASAVAAAASMQQVKDGLVSGTARLGVDQIHAGGFDNLSLLVDGLLSFDGNVALAMRQSLRLYAGIYALSDSADAHARVALSAPYVRLAGVTRIMKDGHILPAVRWVEGLGAPTQQSSDAVFAVTADQIDLRDNISFGVRRDVDTKTMAYTVDRRGFGLLDLTSRGDIRLLGSTQLATPGNITLTAAQIYPSTGSGGTITAGYTKSGNFVGGSVLDIHRYSDIVPDMPYSAFGGIALLAETINQGGIVRVPLGKLQLGEQWRGTDTVNLLPGSITSVSGAGLLMPYGGTIDGLSYRYNGTTIELDGVGTSGILGPKRGMAFSAAHLNVEQGALLDLSGGGELAGAGFISGRGGSVDILVTPLVNANPAYTYSSKDNTVYAIVPGHAGAYAPMVQEAGFGLPGIGQQITILDGVPGLPGGTYTLMPSTYALLPGAFRVELGTRDLASFTGAAAIGTGSWSTAGYLGIANTTIRDSLSTRVIITPAATVRAHSTYNEMDYNAFVMADAARMGVPRAMQTVDAKTLDIKLGKPAIADGHFQLRFDGELLMAPAIDSKGFGGTVNVRGLSEVLGAGQMADTGLNYASVYADELSKFNAPRLVLNGAISVRYGQAGRFASIEGEGSLIVRTGASITAAEVILGGSGPAGSIVIEEGASINTASRGRVSYDSSDGFVFIAQGGILAVSNGWIDLRQPTVAGPETGVNIMVGSCISVSCNASTKLVSEGSIAVSTAGAFSIADNVAYGTRNLVLGLSAINLGESASLAAAAVDGRLPAGLTLNQGILEQLLAGNTVTGAPALETLVLNARDGINMFGSTSLDASKVGRLVFGAPAIYGYGAASDVATIRAGEFIWNGTTRAPGAAMAPMLGDGTLNIAASKILFGYGPNSQVSTTTEDQRLVLGFANVNLDASERITANGKSTLAVYSKQLGYVDGEGYRYSGGNLNVVTPLFTGESGSVNRITTGGAITLTGAGASNARPAIDALGATLEFKGQSIAIDTAVVLPSGRLVLNATDDIVLGDNARLDLAGSAVPMFDITKYSWGGDLVLGSSAGNIRQAAGSVIDLSAQHHRGGTLSVTALGSGGGDVNLGGAIMGGASGLYDAGGTQVPYDAAEITVRAQTLNDFAALNQRLNTGNVVGARRFQIKQGDLVIGDEVQARNVDIALDGGALTINGRINASGFQVGAIRLAAMGNLTVNGTLDAHGSGLRLDSYGKIIDSPNRAIVELASVAGTLALAGTTTIDLRSGTDVTSGNDGVARGTLTLNAQRLGGSGIVAGALGTDGASDVALTVAGTPLVRGAKSVVVNAFRSYDAPLVAVPDISGGKPQLITQGYLNDIDADSSAFINAALGNVTLRNRLSGLGNYQLRPGVEIVSKISADNPYGDLTIAGDLDLSGYRYGPDANRSDLALRGFGAPGTLAIRAAGNLNVYGSINDGFAVPAVTPDDDGWLLGNGILPFGGDLVLPVALTLDAGTIFKQGATLNYDLPAMSTQSLPAGLVLPVRVTLATALVLPAGTVVGASIYHADGSIAYAAGTVNPNTVTLIAGMQLDAGTVLRTGVRIAPVIWPKGIPLPVEMTSTAAISLAVGAFIPSMTDVKLVDAQPVNLRPETDGRQGRNWAVAPMLGEGATSWDLRLTAGADLTSADRRALNPASTSTIRLADTHYVSGFSTQLIGGTKWVWAADNMFGMPEGDTVPQGDVEFYCNEWPGTCRSEPTLVWAENNGPGHPVGTLVADIDLNVCVTSPAFCKESAGTLEVTGSYPIAPAFSVVRTGTGDLELIAAGNIRMDSLYGVYTAGTATAVDAAYTRARGAGVDGSPVGQQPDTLDYGSALASYRAWYPERGGNVLIAAGGDLVGDIFGKYRQSLPSVMVGNWLWRQGTGTAAVDEAIPTAWWINFGTYGGRLPKPANEAPDLLGFTGIGTLGGGNLSIRVGGNAGAIDLRGIQDLLDTGNSRSQGLVVAIGSTGRVGADGSLTLTGGGDLDMRIAGALNPNLALTLATERHALPGALVNLRGAMHVSAESIGGLKLLYRSGNGFNDTIDPRGIDPFVATSSDARSGITLVPGDAAAYLDTRRDLVLGGAGDPGRSDSPNRSAFSFGAGNHSGDGNSWFSLWTDHTAINLTSAGGNLTPTTSSSENPYHNSDQNMADGSFTYPSVLRAAALSGSMYYGVNALSYMRAFSDLVPAFVTLAPGARGALEMLARDSIYGGQYSFSMSGSSVPLPTPFNPAFFGTNANAEAGTPIINVTNIRANTQQQALFAFGWNTAASGLERAPNAEPIRFYAREGDVVGLRTGDTLTDGIHTWYNAAAPLNVHAGRDVVSAGLAPGVLQNSVQGLPIRGNLIVHANPSDVSAITAGRDIIYANFDIAGPGALEVTAGRNLYQAEKGSLTSIGAITPGDNRPGASIFVAAGNGPDGVNYTALERYLDPANLLPADLPLGASGKVAKTYEVELATWLAQQFDFHGSDSDARSYFATLKPEQRNTFLRQVYFAELKAGGREYNDAASTRYGSYLRGRNAIAALFPQQDMNGSQIVRNGDITMFGGSGVRTNFGGDIQMLAPGGKIIVGVQGEVPPASAGIVTQGTGNIQLYSQGSVLLGLSRIMTTFGGDILAWSADGDINAGRGAKTTVLYTPPKRVYDQWGNVTQAPQVPSSGAGIATLNPIAEIAPGDIDLIAPLGTIDAGEAGIRVSGNVNLAALQVVNAANIQVQGKATGIPLIAAVNVGALTNASAAASSAAAAAQDVMQRDRNEARKNLPSIFTVRVLGFGNEGEEAPRRNEGSNRSPSAYDPNGAVEVLGQMDLSEKQLRQLTETERRNLRR